jgi:hypothetical protein
VTGYDLLLGMPTSRLVKLSVVGVAALCLGLGFRSLIKSDSSSNPVRIVASGSSKSGDVFYVSGKQKEPASCDDITISRTKSALFLLMGSDGKHDVAVEVVDETFDLAAATSGEQTSITERALGDHIKLVVTVTKQTDDLLADSLSASSALTKPGDPESLRVNWPPGFKETWRGLPTALDGAYVQGLGMWRNIEAPSSTDSRAAEELADSWVTLHWRANDPASESQRSVGGIVVGASQGMASGTANGYDVVVLAETQAEAVQLVQKVRKAAINCPIIEPVRKERVTGTNFSGYIDTDGTTCPTRAGVTGQMGSAIIDGASIDCANDLMSAAVVFGEKGQKRLAVLAGPRVHTIRVSTANAESVAPVHRNPEGQFGLTLFPADTPDTEFFRIQGVAIDGKTLGTRSGHLFCRYTEPCSAFANLLSLPPIKQQVQGALRVELHVGAAALPSAKIESTREILGSDRPESLEPHVCALADLFETTNTGDRAGPDRDGLSACEPAATMSQNTLRVATETLDYVGALTQSVTVVGDSVVSVRVSTREGAFVVPVQRNKTGPGAVTFEDPSKYGEVEVTYEGLDRDGRVIATR